jgi:3-phenylpropionate/cinnamic acid dioxygenase small subunit
MGDYAEISSLLYRYAELLNTGQFEQVGELFSQGQVSVEGNPRVYVGAAEVAEMYRSTTSSENGVDSLLFTSNVQVSVQGEQATAKSYFIAYHQRPGVILPVVGGRYRDRFKRNDGKWTFVERIMTIDLIGDLGSHLKGNIEDYISRPEAGTNE